jgi:hypothetical protein
MQKTTSSSSTSAKAGTIAFDQARHSFLFRLPLELRLEIYSYLFTKTILHVEAVHPYVIKEQSLMVCPELEELFDVRRIRDEIDWKGYEVKPNGEVVLLNNHEAAAEPIGRFVEIEDNATCSRLFNLYHCSSNISFKSASACPPGYWDHVDCGKIKTGPTRAFRRTCRQSYLQTADPAQDAKLYTALQFTDLEDIAAFSMLLTDDQREDIRHIRVNLDKRQRESQAWYYFCNVFATPWDRRSIKHHFDNEDDEEDDDYPNHKAEISFDYNYSSRALANYDFAPTLPSSWVLPSIQIRWEYLSNSWGTITDLSRLRARAPLSVRFAIPQFLARKEDGEIDIYMEGMWDNETGGLLYPGDEGHIRLSERPLIEMYEMKDLLAEKRRILASVKAEEKDRLQKSYNKKFHYHWHEPHSDQAYWGRVWLRPLRQCQHFESLEIDFYDEDGPRSTMGLEVLRDCLKERFTSLGIGPHPFLLYSH